jgi:alanine racemase
MAIRGLAEINLAAIGRNIAVLRGRLRPGTRFCAVVKADAYGHGAPAVAAAALGAGADVLGVATAGEARELRRAGVTAPVIVLGALSIQELPVALAAGAELVVWDLRMVAAIENVLRQVGPADSDSGRGPVRVHVKLDSGMGRLGTREPEEGMAVASAVLQAGPRLELAGVMTHFATADSDQDFVARQLEMFVPFADRVRALAGPDHPLTVHAANSAATLLTPESHFDMVRCGIAIYGGDPMNEDPSAHGLEPAMALRTYVAALKRAAPGDSAGYGRRFIADSDTWIATLPLGYADGVRRALSDNCEVLIGGRRYPLVGTVSMDYITVDVGQDPAVKRGQQATLLGPDGAERQTAEDLARRIGTISYEVMCGVSGRVPRIYHRDDVPV